jgi:hypothetical protein
MSVKPKSAPASLASAFISDSYTASSDVSPLAAAGAVVVSAVSSLVVLFDVPVALPPLAPLVDEVFVRPQDAIDMVITRAAVIAVIFLISIFFIVVPSVIIFHLFCGSLPLTSYIRFGRRVFLV